MPPVPPERYRSDDCLWFFNAVPAYLAESGDTAFLDRAIPYADRGEATVLGHLRRALEFNLERTGRHGLPCGLAADWNDCLQLGFRGESVFVAFQVRLALTVYADLCARLGREAERTWALAQRDTLDAAIQKHCWDGEWFVWAFGEDGTVFGSRNCAEGRIYLNTQAWAVISGAATPAQADTCLGAVRRLLASEYGVAICAPPFERTPVTVMRAVLMNPGNKENGGIFSHTQSWAVLAEILRGNGDQAYACYRSFLPSAQNDRAEIRQIEPFAHCQSTHARCSPRYGASRVPWLSGTASWSHYTATQWILGIRPEIDGLRIDPCIPAAWEGFEATRVFRGATYRIAVRNPRRVCRGVARLVADGRTLAGSLLPPAAPGATVAVEATLG
jgi:cellobiose phosphorylase